MYPEFAKTAAEEGFKDAELLFNQIAKVEAKHRDRYKKLLDKVKNGTVYNSEKPIQWKCGVCGYIVEGNEPPAKCPCCKHPKEHYIPSSL